MPSAQRKPRTFSSSLVSKILEVGKILGCTIAHIVLLGCQVVATVGATLPDGTEVKKATVGGVPSHGMLCDAPMLGWLGGGAGAAALVPDTFSPGDPPPTSRPRMDKPQKAEAGLPAVEVKPLFEKKLTKEEKKAAAAAKKAEREAKKAAGKLSEFGPDEPNDQAAGLSALSLDSS